MMVWLIPALKLPAVFFFLVLKEAMVLRSKDSLWAVCPFLLGCSLTDCCQGIRDRTALHSLHTRPCKVEVSYPYSELCKYELLDQTVCCTHTLTHTPRWPMHAHTMVSLRPSPPASLAAKSGSHNQSPVCMKPYPHRRGVNICYPSNWMSAHSRSWWLVCFSLTICAQLCPDWLMTMWWWGEMQVESDGRATKSNTSWSYYETWRTEDVIPRNVPQGI